MLSVNGIFGDEIFAALAADQRLADDERTAASAIAADLRAVREYEVATADIAPDDRPSETAARERNWRMAGYGADHCSYRYGRILFRVWPYTTGQTANVAITNI